MQEEHLHEPPLPAGSDPVPCISLWQPWASLWASGKKQIETRSWRPATYRLSLPAWVAVHASKKFDERLLCRDEPFVSSLAAIGYGSADELPVGKVVGFVYVSHVYRFQPAVPCPLYPERAFGDYTDGRFGWVGTRFRLLAEPIAARGMQGLWRWAPPVPWDDLRFGPAVHGKPDCTRPSTQPSALKSDVAAQGMLF